MIPFFRGNGFITNRCVFRGVMDTEKTSQISPFTHLSVNFLWNVLFLVLSFNHTLYGDYPFKTIRFNFSGYPFSNFGTKSFMRFLVIWSMPSLIPTWVTKRTTITKDIKRFLSTSFRGHWCSWLG